jgi:predicted nucleic acid-binding protein
MRGAEGMIRRLDLPLRAPDATHIMIARRLGASLATFDTAMAAAAAAWGVETLGA